MKSALTPGLTPVELRLNRRKHGLFKVDDIHVQPVQALIRAEAAIFGYVHGSPPIPVILLMYIVRHDGRVSSAL